MQALLLAAVWIAADDRLLILSKKDQTLAIVDPVGLQVIGRLPTGPDPHEVTTDGKTAYVSNYGGGRFHSLGVLDLIAQKALPSIDLGALAGPHGLDFKGGKVWFTSETSKTVGRFDPAAGKVDWVMGTGQDTTHMLLVADDQKSVLTTNMGSSTLSILELGKVWTSTLVPTGKGPEGFDLSPDGKEIWVANSEEGSISIVDRRAKKVLATLPANVKSANRLKITPNGKLALVSMLDDAHLAVFDVATRKEVKRVKIGTGAAGILIAPDNARAFVACTPDGYVAVVDLKTFAMTGRIDAGPKPDGMAWARLGM